MPRPAARLSNCYVPLPLSATTTKTESKKRGVRDDDRQSFELRQLCLETSVLGDALGSSLLELGHTKVICRVSISVGEVVDIGTLDCKVQMAPHIAVNPISQRMQIATPATESASGNNNSSSSSNANNTGNQILYHSGRINAQIMAREAYLSSQLHSAIQSSVHLEKFPKCSILVRVTVLQDDGSALSACITGATLALIDAKIPMYDVVTSCSVAVHLPDEEDDDKDGDTKMEDDDDDDDEEATALYLADPNEKELIKSQASICLAISANHKEVTLWNQSGRLTSSQANEAVELARNGCRTMHKFIRELMVGGSSY